MWDTGGPVGVMDKGGILSPLRLDSGAGPCFTPSVPYLTNFPATSIIRWMAERRRRAAASKIEYPTCVRHAQPRKDVRLRHWFLCDDCAEKWTTEAFDGDRSLWNSEPIAGFCLLCNLRKQVRLRTWFLCDICWRVAGSIGRNHVAENAIIEWWREHVERKHSELSIEQHDASSLRPRRSGDTSGESPIDFLIRDTRSSQIVLAIENKTGRSSIREMSAFQLDLSDCDCIMHDVRKYAVPAYLIHAQVLERWEPPTVGFKAVGLWWTDIYQLADNFREVRMRRDENRGAAYFRKQAFQDITTLPDHLYDASGNLTLLWRLQNDGIPQLYRTG